MGRQWERGVLSSISAPLNLRHGCRAFGLIALGKELLGLGVKLATLVRLVLNIHA